MSPSLIRYCAIGALSFCGGTVTGILMAIYLLERKFVRELEGLAALKEKRT